MSSFFTIPGQKKRKRPEAAPAPKKRIAPSRPAKSASRAPSKPNSGPTKRRAEPAKKPHDDSDDSISGSESDDDESLDGVSAPSEAGDDSESEGEGETAAERRLRLAERYLDNVKTQVEDVYGFDAEEIDRDLIAERLLEDVAEEKGKLYRFFASELATDRASHTFFKRNTLAFTAVAACSPYVYTTTKDLYLQKWRIQDLPQDQYPEKKNKKKRRRKSSSKLNNKAPAPPRRQPALEQWIQGDRRKIGDNNYKRHVDQILCVAASQDGKYVVTGGEDKRMIVYDAATLKPLKVFTHHRDAVTGLAFRRGTNQLYSCSKDRSVKVWSLDELAYVQSLFGHQDEVVDIDALAQERCVSVGARDRTARLWKVVDEMQLVFRGRGNAVDKKSQLPPELDHAALAHEGSMDRVAMIDDDLFVTGSDNGSLALWSLQKKKPIFVVPLTHGADPPPEPAQASGEANAQEKDVASPPCPRWITALKTIPYSDVIFSGSWDGCIRIWRLSADKKRIEASGLLGAAPRPVVSAKRLLNGSGSEPMVNGHHEEEWEEEEEASFRIKGVVNDIAVFERGDRGNDGICVVAAVGKEHRLGRWKQVSGARNGGVVFEVPRVLARNGANGVHDDDAEESDHAE